MKQKVPDRSPLLWLLLPFCIGLVAVHLAGAINLLMLAALGICAAVAAFSCHKQNKTLAWAIALSAAAFSAGAIRYSSEIPEDLDREAFPQREATLDIAIERVFTSRTGALLGFATSIDPEEHLRDLAEKRIYFALFQDNAGTPFLPGAKVRVRGVLQPFIPDASNSFHDFLSANRIQLSLTRGNVIEILKPAPFWRIKAAEINNTLHGVITRGIEDLPEVAQTYAAMTLGLKSELSPDQKDAFLKSGAMHLFAISGLHVGVIAMCGHSLLLLFRVPKNSIPYLNCLIALAFVMITGGAASAWRAFAMIACYYLSHVSRRQPSPLNALVLSALICLIIDPRQLFQAGFQMSYATVAAILMYGLPFATTMQAKWAPFQYLPRSAWKAYHLAIDKAGKYLISSTCVCIAAFTTSSILSIAYFDLLSVAGGLINLLYLPLATLVISAGFCSILCSFVFLDFLSVIFNHAAALLLSLLHSVAASAAGSRFTYFSFSHPNQSLLLISLVGIIALIAYQYSSRWQDRSRTFALPPLCSVLVALAVALLS